MEWLSTSLNFTSKRRCKGVSPNVVFLIRYERVRSNIVNFECRGDNSSLVTPGGDILWQKQVTQVGAGAELVLWAGIYVVRQTFRFAHPPTD